MALHSKGSRASDVKYQSGLARILGSGTAGFLELALFHPVDTVAKRLMSNHGSISSRSHLNKIIFKEHASAVIGKKIISLFPGLGYAACYKILQRIYKYSGQPYVNDYLGKHHGSTFESIFGKGNGKAIMSATAGSIIGIGEIILLPLDILKIKRQTNPEAFAGRGIVKIITDERMELYRGAAWTAARNAPGSFALFGGSAFAKQYLFQLNDYLAASWSQNFIASVFGAVSSLTVSAPLDVVKTRIQNRNFIDSRSGTFIVTHMVKNEGLPAFFKGLFPKLLTAN